MSKNQPADLKRHIRRVVENIEPELLPDEAAELVDQMESSLAAYALQAAKDKREKQIDPELKQHRQEALKKSIAIALNGIRNLIERQSQESRAEKRLRGLIDHVLKAVRIGLTKDEKSKIEDRMIRLLDEYAKAPNEKKEAVYSRGEEEVFSTLDPPAQSRGASAW